MFATNRLYPTSSKKETNGKRLSHDTAMEMTIMVQNIIHDTLAFDIAADDENAAAESRANPAWLRRLWQSIELSQRIKAEREIARVLRWRGIEAVPSPLLPPDR